MGKFFYNIFSHSLEKISLEARRLLELRLFWENLLLLIHLHFNPFFLLNLDVDGPFLWHWHFFGLWKLFQTRHILMHH